jgi:hypothetical protein
MKKIIIMFVVGLLTQQITQAQGTVYLSNLGQTSIGSETVGSDSWRAAAFETGNNTSGYTLNSVQLAMTVVSGSPDEFAVMLYAQSGNPSSTFPGSSIDSLSGSANPSVGGIYTYIAPDVTLSPNTFYFIVITAGTAVANGAYEWSYVNVNSYNQSGGWSSLGSGWTSSDGSSWNRIAGAPQYAITATAIPEPSTVSLILLGSGIFIYVRNRNKKATNGEA